MLRKITPPSPQVLYLFRKNVRFSLSSSSSSQEDGFDAMYGAGWDSGGTEVKIGVWWDFENCNVPFGIDAHKVGINIVSGLRSSGFKGPVSISGYGDMLQLSRSVQESLSATGIRLHHVPSGGKESESSDRALLMDLILWTIENPPPAHLFLISGDRDFATALHKLRMRNYNVLLACPAGGFISPALLGAASRVWYWNSLVRGESLIATTSWSTDGPPPKPILPPKPPFPSPPQQKTPYFSTQEPPPCSQNPPSPNVSPYSVSSPHFPSVSTTHPFPCPPVPPPFSNSNNTPLHGSPSNASPPPLHNASPSHLHGSPNTTSSPPLHGKPRTDTCQPGKLNNKPSKKLVKPDKSTKPEPVVEVLARLDALLKEYPQGIWFGELQSLMVLRKIHLDSDYFGHKKLVPYLLTLPRIARVERHLMKDNKTWSYIFFSPAAPASDMQSSRRAGYPVEVLRQLSELFKRYPKGIWLGELNAQLVAQSITLENNFYGHVKIVPFLLSLPEMVKVERRYLSDRWNYIFIFNPSGTVYTESKSVKKLLSTDIPSKDVTLDEVKEKEEQKEDTTTEYLQEDIQGHPVPVHDGGHALVTVEEQVVTFRSRLAAASESIFGFFRKIYQRFWKPEEPVQDKLPMTFLEEKLTNEKDDTLEPREFAQEGKTFLEQKLSSKPEKFVAEDELTTTVEISCEKLEPEEFVEEETSDSTQEFSSEKLEPEDFLHKERSSTTFLQKTEPEECIVEERPSITQKLSTKEPEEFVEEDNMTILEQKLSYEKDHKLKPEEFLQEENSSIKLSEQLSFPEGKELEDKSPQPSVPVTEEFLLLEETSPNPFHQPEVLILEEPLVEADKSPVLEFVEQSKSLMVIWDKGYAEDVHLELNTEKDHAPKKKRTTRSNKRKACDADSLPDVDEHIDTDRVVLSEEVKPQTGAFPNAEENLLAEEVKPQAGGLNTPKQCINSTEVLCLLHNALSTNATASQPEEQRTSEHMLKTGDEGLKKTRTANKRKASKSLPRTNAKHTEEHIDADRVLSLFGKDDTSELKVEDDTYEECIKHHEVLDVLENTVATQRVEEGKSLCEAPTQTKARKKSKLQETLASVEAPNKRPRKSTKKKLEGLEVSSNTDELKDSVGTLRNEPNESNSVSANKKHIVDKEGKKKSRTKKDEGDRRTEGAS